VHVGVVLINNTFSPFAHRLIHFNSFVTALKLGQSGKVIIVGDLE
jgi:hypothetical protein